MTTVTVITMVAVAGLMLIIFAGLVLTILVRARARTVLGRFQSTLRKQIAKNEKETIEQRKDLAAMTNKISWLEKKLLIEKFNDLLPLRPKTAARSVLFLHNETNHFEQLAAALRRRGWDAVSVNNLPATYNRDSHYRRQTLNLFSNDPGEFRARLRFLHDLVPSRFRLVHFGGESERRIAFFRNEYDLSDSTSNPALWNFRELKERGVKIAYTTSGCFDGIRQSAFREHTGVCSSCAWELRPDLCSDERNAAWGESIVDACDLVTIEGDYANEWRRQSFVIREPLTSVLDPSRWKPELEIPKKWRLDKSNGALIVVHDSGDPASRSFGERDIKGTGATIEAIERLQSDGVNVRLVKLANVPRRYKRFIQAQADVIVDQLVVGRYGALAQEGMMLGKPTICYIDSREPEGVPELACWDECPLVSATEDTVYPVLKRLLSSSDERKQIGRASRIYALKWHAAENAAMRYEQIYDRIMEEAW